MQEVAGRLEAAESLAEGWSETLRAFVERVVTPGGLACSRHMVPAESASFREWRDAATSALTLLLQDHAAAIQSARDVEERMREAEERARACAEDMEGRAVRLHQELRDEASQGRRKKSAVLMFFFVSRAAARVCVVMLQVLYNTVPYGTVPVRYRYRVVRYTVRYLTSRHHNSASELYRTCNMSEHPSNSARHSIPIQIKHAKYYQIQHMKFLWRITVFPYRTGKVLYRTNTVPYKFTRTGTVPYASILILGI